MHVVMLSDIDTEGGAAVASCRLAKGLCEAGHCVTRLVNSPSQAPHPWQTQSLLPKINHNIMRRFVPGQRKEQWEQTAAGRRLEKALNALRPDVINIHNLHSAGWAGWSSEMLRVCARHAPVVWTLHDMWSFTGRCAYSYDCRRFETGCTAACPTPDEYPPLTPPKIAPAWEQRREVIDANQSVAVVTPSRWLAQEAKAGLWSKHHVEVIPYGLPLDVYRPWDRADARRQLGITPLGPVLLVAANDFSERRKGGWLFREALEHSTARPLTVIVMGRGELSVMKSDVKIFRLGYVGDEEQKAMVYSAADVYVHAAPVDNLPNTVLEAIACGTPVIGLPVGGVPDMVRPSRTGWLADAATPAGLAAALDRALADLEQGTDLRDTCRQIANTDYSAEIQAEQYSALFQELIAKPSRSAETALCQVPDALS